MVKYPVVVEPGNGNYAASPVQFAGLATAGTREEVLVLAAEQVALGLLEVDTPPVPADVGEIDLSDYEEGSEVVYVEPAPVNPVSVALEAAIKRKGISQSELARRAGMPRSVVSRLTDPFYFGHSLRSLNEVAAALDAHVEVVFLPGVRAAGQVPAA